MKLIPTHFWLLFSGAQFYPVGGAGDFVASFRTKKQAVNRLTKLPIDSSDSWAHIINVRTRSMERPTFGPTPTSA